MANSWEIQKFLPGSLVVKCAKAMVCTASRQSVNQNLEANSNWKPVLATYFSFNRTKTKLPRFAAGEPEPNLNHNF